MKIAVKRGTDLDRPEFAKALQELASGTVTAGNLWRWEEGKAEPRGSVVLAAALLAGVNFEDLLSIRAEDLSEAWRPVVGNQE